MKKKKKLDFIRGIEHENAFNIIKDKLCFAPILTISKFSKSFKIECDTPGLGIGVVLILNGLTNSFFQ